MRISTQNIACSQRQMYTCTHHSVIHYEHTSCKQGSRTSDQFNTSIGKKQERQYETRKREKSKYNFNVNGTGRWARGVGWWGLAGVGGG